jgi:hypothetical protein
MVKVIFCSVLLLITGNAPLLAQPGGDTMIGLEPGQFSVGFQLLETDDYSRVVTAGSSPSTTHPRPMRTYLWYPASHSDGAQTMRFGRYAELADGDIWPAKIAGTLSETLKYSRKALARSLGLERFEALLKQPVTAVEKAEPLDGPFPLIVIGQGLYYESPVAFAVLGEFLASQGFVVVTCPLVGTNSPIVMLDVVGLETQVRDLEFAVAQARQLPFVSGTKLGVFGFDMGAMAGLILTMRNADVDAFASVSSGILYPHPSGIPIASPDYDPLAFRVPWLHSVPASWIKESGLSDDKSLFDLARYSERYLLLTQDMGHVDYTGYALVEDRPALAGYWEAAKPGDPDRFVEIARIIANFYAAYLKDDPESLASLLRAPTEAVSGATMTLEHRSATTATITYEEFVQAVINGRAEDAIEEVRALQQTHPDHILLNETYLQRLAISLSATWGLDEEILPVLKFRAELYPSSAEALNLLAEGYVKLGDHPSAIDAYTRLLELDLGDFEHLIQSRLEWLLTQ